MIINLPTKPILNRHHCSKHLSELYPQDGAEKPAGIDTEINYVTHPMYTQVSAGRSARHASKVGLSKAELIFDLATPEGCEAELI